MSVAETITTVAVIGGGLMGSGIAESAAGAGHAVVLCDVDQAAIQQASRRLEVSLARAIEGGKRNEADAVALRERITLSTELDDISAAGLVIEAVPEDQRLKLEVMTAIAQRVPERTIIASNTSSIPIAQLAAAIEHPDRVLGLHFFSPVPVMRLVEIVVGIETSAQTVSIARDFAQGLGKTPIQSRDRAGFIVNLLLVPYLMSAVRMFEEGFASCEDIDSGMRLGCGHPMGPLTLSDFIGLDVLCSIGDSLYDEFRRPEYSPPPLLRRMVAAGRLGRKSGQGFYQYG
jgi:3-hydroxybutyryl-CoA dehydrogenase